MTELREEVSRQSFECCCSAEKTSTSPRSTQHGERSTSPVTANQRGELLCDQEATTSTPRAGGDETRGAQLPVNHAEDHKDGDQLHNTPGPKQTIITAQDDEPSFSCVNSPPPIVRPEGRSEVSTPACKHYFYSLKCGGMFYGTMHPITQAASARFRPQGYVPPPPLRHASRTGQD